MKNILIAVVLILALFGGYKMIFGGADRTKPEAVAAAFTAALKSHNFDKASKYWLPEGAEAWSAAAKDKVGKMATGTMTRFYEDLSDGTTPFTMLEGSHIGNEQTMMSGTTAVSLRQVDGKWYVIRAPV